MAKQTAQSQTSETPAQIRKRENDHYSHIFRVFGGVSGILIGSRLLGNIVYGLVLGIVMGFIGNVIANKIWSEK